MFGGLPVPFQSFLIGLFDSFAVSIQSSEPELCIGISLISRLPIPSSSLFVKLFYTSSFLVQIPRAILGLDITQIGI